MDLDQHKAQTIQQIEANLERAANRFAEAVRAKLPRDTGDTARRVRIKAKPGERVVVIPFPWQFNEYGFIHVGGKYIKPNPVVRNTLVAMGDELKATIAGEQ